ncbi:MAG TPA: virulence factor [Anaerolineae bacterium]|nr:virulence factor [Anaerolineae bacterium]HNU04068.1 virulence factor [Anaerolineae bacterium]
MAHYQILYWHDIPLQVRGRAGRERANVSLPPRFQEAIDAAAMAARLTGDEAYTDGLRWSDPVERPGAPAEVAAAVAAELDQQYAVIDWRKTAEALRA